mgnify:CR=1 FL=1
MNKMKRLTGRKILLVAVAFCAFGFAKAQDTQTEKNTLTLTLDKALEIALDENPTMKVAAEEIALKRVASKEAWQSLLPEASIAGSLDHTIKAAEMKLNDMSFKMGQDGSNTANAGLSINLPLFVPGVYRAMSMTKTDIELAVEKSRASKLDLVNQVSKAYYQLMLAQDSYEVLQGSYKLAEDNYNPLAELNKRIFKSANRFVVNVVYILKDCKCTYFPEYSGKQSYCIFSIISHYHELIA